jgi:lipopolysaccharide/colanic/teichoic acid biosynthesis glycosyltransferase/glycosyltransferase involved in cell wall biosynthesis
MGDPSDGAAARKRQLRVAHLTTVDMSLALLLSTELQADLEAGHEVFGISSPGPYVDEVERLGVHHVAVPALTRAWDPRSDLRAIRQLWQVIRALDLDVLHTHNPKTGVIGRVLARLARVPVVVNTCHGLWAGPDDPLLKRVAVLGIEGVAAQFSHAELFQNAADRDALRWAVPRRKAEVVGNGVDLERFRFDTSGRARVRAEWGVSDEEVLVGGVGRLVDEKGVQEVSIAAQALEGRARFVWVGPADDAKPDRVTERLAGIALIGERRDMPAVYSALDVFVLPSYREGFSRSAMEAAACGRAMVLSDIRGCREIGEDLRHLLLVPAGDVPALVDALAELIGDAGLRARLGGAAASRARESFDQRAVAWRSLATYEEVLGRRRWRGRRRPSAARPARRARDLTLRRAVDVVLAATALLVLSPLLALAALAVRLRLGSPVLFRQQRSGRFAAEFTILKLRTMRAERYPGEPDADRTPRLGHLLRSTSLDELPQLINVIRGDMTLIGPRPTLPEQVARYGAHERRRLEVRPGLTGWAQVNGRNALSWPERIELDIWYIDHRSLALDLRILGRTVARLLRPSGVTAEGGVNPDFPGATEGTAPSEAPE